MSYQRIKKIPDCQQEEYTNKKKRSEYFMSIIEFMILYDDIIYDDIINDTEKIIKKK